MVGDTEWWLEDELDALDWDMLLAEIDQFSATFG